MQSSPFRTMLALLLLSAAPVMADDKEALPPGTKLVAIEAVPSSVRLQHRYEYVQLILTGRTETGQTIDVTRIADVAESGEVAELSAGRLVRPKADGRGELIFSLAGQNVSVPVEVSGVAADYHVNFSRDVAPVLSKMGCNAGTCHGSKDGRNGFKLSLRGYDLLFDHRALTDDLGARRINRASPEDSLMLLKATGSVPHVGGQLTQPGQIYYELVRTWIADGVKLDLSTPRVAGIEIFPTNPVVEREGMKQQMRVVATYADGAVRDVTAEAFIESGNMDVTEVDRAGLVKALRRGESPVLARYEGAYTATTVTVMGDRTGFVWEQPSANNTIDELVAAKLQRMKTLSSPTCTDDEFLRRVYLDLIGLPPTSDEVRAFLADERDSRTKRDEVIDRLVGSHAYVEHWANKWADLLQVNDKFLGREGSVAFRNWIKQAVSDNMPYDKFVYSIVTASGSNRENPPASYYKVLRVPEDTMENTTHLFLAVRFNCNKCHDHPFERWTQDQYYHLSAYFAQVGLKKDPAGGDRNLGQTAVEGAKPLYEVVFDKSSGDVKHERTGEIAPPEFPYETEYETAENLARREQLARWMTSPDNRYFAKSYANRLWGYLLGVGIIEPIDDIRAGNPASNPELLDWLTHEFITSGFDAQNLVRTIAKSQTYQRSVVANKWNEDDSVNYSHALARRLPAEVLYDTVHRVAGSISRLPGMPEGMRAAELPDAGVKLPSGFLDQFGKPARESACECERTTGLMLGPIMALVNGPTIADAIADPNNAITKLVNEEKADARLVEEMFLRILNRRPSESELKTGIQALHPTSGEHQKLVEALSEYEAALPAKLAQWEQQRPRWVPLDPKEMSTTNGATLTREDDLSIFASGTNGKVQYHVTFQTDLAGITAFRLELLPDKRLPHGGPGRSPVGGNFVLNELSITAAAKSQPDKAQPVALQAAEADKTIDWFPINKAIDDRVDEAEGWASAQKEAERRVAVFGTASDVGYEGGTILKFVLDQQYKDGSFTIGRFRISVSDSPRPVKLDVLPDDVAALVAVPVPQRDQAQQAALMKYFRDQDSELKRRQQAVALSAEQLANERLSGAQDLAWALINSPAFLFNR